MKQSIIYWSYIIILSVICQPNFAQDTTTVTMDAPTSLPQDSTQVDTQSIKKKKYDGARFMRIGVDAKSIVFPLLFPGKSMVEVSLDYKYREKSFLVTEAGWGRGAYDYPHMAYNTNAYYFRAGIENSLLTPRHPFDFDVAFVGFRYAIGVGNRGDATYTFDSPFGGTFTNTVDAESFFVHWGEAVAGMKLEVMPRLFLGWTGRAKFLFNNSRFKNIKPHYIAGYGNADNSTSFDIGLNVQYIIFKK